MRIRTRSIAALPLTLALAACGGGGDDDGGGGGGAGPDAGTEEEDLTAPFVVSSTPANGDVGVRADAPVVIVFSEPMDGESVEGSLATASLGEVTLSWNAAGDTLTITPVEPLAYAEGVGTDPDAIDALVYNVVVGTAPVDLAGNPITEGYQTVFRTYKSLETTFEIDNLLTGSITTNGGQLGDDDPILIGDDNNDLPYRGLMSFDISALPADAAEIAAATFATRQESGLGAPYASLGTKLQLEHVSFTDFDASEFSKAPHASMGDFSEAGQVVIEVDVTSAVEDDRANRADRGDRSQYRLRYELATDEDGTADLAVISRALAELTVTYLHP